MKIVREFLVLLIVSAFFISANPTAWAADSWATDPKTGCQIGWVSDSYNIVAATWSGPKVNNKAEGKGALTVTTRGKDGKETQGQADAEMKAGKLDGKVSIKWSDGASYDGYYKVGVREGRGMLKQANGQVYEGDFKNGLMDGKGVYKWANGDTYDGDWKNGKMEGMGIYKKPDGGYSEGEWKSSVMDGKGKINWANGQIDIGYFKNGWMEGKGVIKYPNGNTYEGDFRDGKLNGYGVLKDPDGKVIYEGQWKDGQRGTGQDISDEARKHLNWGTMALESAKTPADIEDSMEEFNIAIKLAPDYADAYYRLGVVQEMVNKNDDALKNLKKYLELSPAGATVKEAKHLIDKLEYKAYKKEGEKKEEEENKRIEKYGVNFNYTPPTQETPNSAGVTFAVVNVGYQSNSNTHWSSWPQFANLDKAIKEDLTKLLAAKGFSVRGPFDSYNLIPSPDKKAIDLYLVPTIELSVNTPVDVYSIKDIKVEVTGEITLELREIVTRKLMWSKSIPFSKFEFPYIIKKIIWKNLADIRDMDNPNVKKTIATIEFGTTNMNDIARGIEKQYPDLMATISKLIDPEEMRIIKKQCQELKSKKGY